jgi:hypothetical protein
MQCARSYRLATQALTLIGHFVPHLTLAVAENPRQS